MNNLSLSHLVITKLNSTISRGKPMQQKLPHTLWGIVLLLLVHSVSFAATDLPPSAKVDLGPVEDVCSNFISPEARKEQVIDGVKIQESLLCDPDAP
jgi:manganese oxidase